MNSFYEKIRVLSGGDAKGGFLIDLHDGQNSAVYSPDAKDMNEAVKKALADHAKAFSDAPTESDYVPEEAADPVADLPVETTVGAAPAASAETTQPAQTDAG